MKTKFYKYLMAIVLLCGSMSMMALDNCVRFTSTMERTSVSSVTLNHESIVVSTKGAAQEIQLEAIIGPTNAYYQDVTWTCTGVTGVTVDNTGKVTIPKGKKGTITVTATLVDSVSGTTYKKTCSISATDKIPQTKAVTLNVNDMCADPGENISIYTDCGLQAYKELKNGVPNGIITTPALVFTSGNTSIATVSDAGTVTISSAAQSGEYVNITIADQSAPGVILGTVTLQITGSTPTSITLNQATATIYIRKGQRSVQLVPTVVTPKCASRDVVWTSSDGSIATVDENGLVTAVDLSDDHTITVTATSVVNPTVTDSCIVTICRKYPFTVAPNTWVEFSTGNLQYNAMEGTHATADDASGITGGTWRFAENEWDVIGADNANVSGNYNGWIDLFGWGTSGWNSGKDIYYHPWDTQGAKDDYAILCVDGTFRSTKPFYDWGIYNSIEEQIGSAQITHAPGSWRTLERTEWEYLIGVALDGNGGSAEVGNHRVNALNLHTMGTVNGVPGLLLLPDEWDWSLVSDDYPADKRWATAVRDYTTYQLTVAEWHYLEVEGAIFLPANGRRQGQGDKMVGSITPVECGVNGYYWSGSDFCQNHANVMNFTSTMIGVQENHKDVCNRCNGYSVRLVRDINL